MGSAIPPLRFTKEHIVALRTLSDRGKPAVLSQEAIESLLEARLAWVGPPPQSRVVISYRGRQALREANGEADALAASYDMTGRPIVRRERPPPS